MIATVVERDIHDIRFYTLDTESHSFAGVCLLAFKHNNSRSDKRSRLTLAFQHTQSSVLEAETNQESKEIEF